MVSPFPSSPMMRALTIGGFILGAALYGVGLYYSFANIGPQQEQLKAKKEAVSDWMRKRNDE